MRIAEIIQSSLTTTGLTREQFLQNLKPGQILQATALTENQDGQVKLQIGVTRLIAQTRLSVTPGQTLSLTVEKTGELPELKLIPLPSIRQLQARALKGILPRQQPLQPVMDTLRRLEKPDSGLPPPLREPIRQLFGQLLSADEPALRQKLQQALLDSGLFTESRLLQRESATADIKVNLLRLLQLLQGLMKQSSVEGRISPTTEGKAEGANDPGLKLLASLFKQLDGAIARIQTNQLASLPREDSQGQIWHFELPIRQHERIDLWQIMIRREQASAKDIDEPVWSLSLRMDLPSLGPMRFQLRMQGESISTIIQAERETTLMRVEQHLAHLKQAFEAIGLQVSRLDARQGRVENANLAPPTDLSLLYEKV